MRVVSCVNGHYFDADKYDHCPTCGAEMAEGKQEGIGEDKSWWSGKGNGRFNPRKHSQPELKTEVKPEPKPVPQPAPQTENGADGNENTFSVFEDRENQPAPWPEKKTETEAEKQTEEKEEEHSALKNDLEKATAENRSEKTYGMFQKMMSNPTQNVTPIDPVVGWLVCVKGMQLGASFVLHAGKNTVGRDQDNDIVLDRDNSVSRKRHATVIFEPKKKIFYLQPGESSELTYYNDEFIAEMKKMEDHSVLTLGSTELMLVCLCGEDFSWEEKIQQNKKVE